MTSFMEVIEQRKELSQRKLRELQEKLSASSETLDGKACIYATGSFGRLEANKYSDLDLFIVSLSGSDQITPLTRLDEILVKADLISAVRSLNFPEFDGDGKYLVSYSTKELNDKLGLPEDDYSNTLTSRLLLFLESRPLVENSVYSKVIDEVIAAYWADYPDHNTDFVPAFLTNDILRLWRTFCVNYEARTRPITDNSAKVKRKIKNYKLKHSRMMTCYSSLLYLLFVYGNKGTVSVDDAKRMIKMTPIERILEIKANKQGASNLDALLESYAVFLNNTENGDDYLKDKIKNNPHFLNQTSHNFGEKMHASLIEVGGSSKLMKLILV